MLPDGVTHTQGYVKDPEEAKRYLAVGDGDSVQEVAKKMDVDRGEVADKLEDRKKIDLSKNVSVLSFVFFELEHCLCWFVYFLSCLVFCVGI